MVVKGRGKKNRQMTNMGILSAAHSVFLLNLKSLKGV